MRFGTGRGVGCILAKGRCEVGYPFVGGKWRGGLVGMFFVVVLC